MSAAVKPASPPDAARLAALARAEDFPIASRLLPARLRAPVLAFYRFARTADDIADDPELTPADKAAALDRLEAGLLRRGADAPAVAVALAQALAHQGLAPVAALDLLRAFRFDAAGSVRCATWDDLIDYCRFSAMPVGRFLLALHGVRDPRAVDASDALCAALQILNHLRDCKADYVERGRVYLPTAWMAETGARPDMLADNAASPALRAVFARVLLATRGLLDQARPLPRHIAARGLRIQAQVTLAMADAHARRLVAADPLAESVRLSGVRRLRAVAEGLLRGAAA